MALDNTFQCLLLSARFQRSLCTLNLACYNFLYLLIYHMVVVLPFGVVAEVKCGVEHYEVLIVILYFFILAISLHYQAFCDNMKSKKVSPMHPVRLFPILFLADELTDF